MLTMIFLPRGLVPSLARRRGKPAAGGGAGTAPLKLVKKAGGGHA
jgi:branched-chain amino acid transport system permease protein